MPETLRENAVDPEAIAPLVKEITVRCSPERAFEVFTARMADWWPLATHSVAAEQAIGVTLDGHVGGRLFETDAEGKEHRWGKVLRWDPPHSVAFTWHPGRGPETAQEVALDFDPTPVGTRVVLTHSGWASLGAEAATTRAGYAGGWEEVLCRRYREAASA